MIAFCGLTCSTLRAQSLVFHIVSLKLEYKENVADSFLSGRVCQNSLEIRRTSLCYRDSSNYGHSNFEATRVRSQKLESEVFRRRPIKSDWTPLDSEKRVQRNQITFDRTGRCSVQRIYAVHPTESNEVRCIHLDLFMLFSNL